MNTKYPKRRIDSLGRIITGKTPPTKNKANFGGSYPFITIPDLGSNVFVSQSERSLSEEGAKSIRTSKVPAGSVMMSCIATVGKCGITTCDSFTNQQINTLVPSADANSRFIYYAFLLLKEDLEVSGSGGATYTNVSKSRFGELEIPYPSMRDQESISGILGALDDRIDVNRRVAATLEEMARALYRSWFVDFDPVRAKEAGEEPAHMDTATAALFPERFSEGGLPDGWRMESIYEIAHVRYGAPFKSSLFNTAGEGRPLVRIRDLKNNRAGVFTTEIHRTEYVLQPGDIVVGMDGDFTPHTWCSEPSLMNQRVCCFQPLHSNDRAFLRYALPALLKSEEDVAVATTVIHLGKKDIDKFQVIAASDQVKAAFGMMVNPWIDRIVSLGLEGNALAALRKTLLPKLMSGEIQVRDAEAVVAEVA